MRVLYVTEQGSVLQKTGDRLVVKKRGEILLEVPCLKIDAVLIFGNVQVTTQALCKALDHGIALAILSRSGRLRGQLTPPKARNIPLRMRQYEWMGAAEHRLDLAREVVTAKIENAASVLRRFRGNHPEALPPAPIGDLDALRERAAAAGSLDSLRGIEGAAAACYFPLLSAMVPSSFTFVHRSRRPPRDPANALLSFGYVLVGNEIQSLLGALGFDPYLGFFHEVDYGRPSLALDLVEEFRAPLVDRWSASLLNLCALTETDFTATAERGVFLTQAALQRYLVAYESELAKPLAVDGAEVTYRQLFRRQAERLARHLLEGEPYRAFRLPC